MAREGYLILDSDLHMMEPDGLWARFTSTGRTRPIHHAFSAASSRR